MQTAKVRVPKGLERALKQRKARKEARLAVTKAPADQDEPSSEDSGSESETEGSSIRWRPVNRSHMTGFDDAAVLAFEEVEGVDVVYEEVEGGGRVAKLAVSVRSSLELPW